MIVGDRLFTRPRWKAVLRSRLLAGRHVRITAVKKRRRQMSPATHSITSSARAEQGERDRETERIGGFGLDQLDFRG